MTTHVPRLGRRFAATQAMAFTRHASLVTARRLRHGPLAPPWEWPYEVMLSWLRERFAEEGMSFATMRRRLDAVGSLEARAHRRRLLSERAAGVPVVWVMPPGTAQEEVTLYLHGGAYVTGSTVSHAALLLALARRTGRRVLSVEYRLAPEHPCPAAIDDAVTAYRWLLDQGVPASKVRLAGDSAGGGLTLATLLALRDADLPLPAGALLLSPWTDLEVSGDTPHRHARTDYLGTAERIHAFAGHYAGGLSRRDPRVSPLYAPDLAGLPPLSILAGGSEMILDDSTRMADRLREAGVAVDLHVEPHEVHVYPMFARVSERARDGLERSAAFLAR
ncbi:MAG: alpha/beta hydrolase [Alphaproteobacteria bacterium]|nr:alpha/beta hydrolase [Alphaproteobacteria bacterium]